MHIALLNYAYAPGIASPEALLTRYETLTGWAQGLRLAGARVTVWQRFHRDALLIRDAIEYHFVADAFSTSPRLWQIPWRLHHQLLRQRADVLHINGLLFPLQIYMASQLASTSSSIIVAQHHAEHPFAGWRGSLQRWGLRQVDGFLFAARALADPWVEQGVIASQARVFQVMEGSTGFQPQSRASARAESGLQGEPIFLWVGNLHPRKDPLTVLAAFEQLLLHYPGARLYMIYGTAELLPQIQARMAQSAALQRAVTLLGQLPHAALERYYNSADYFILGSHYEGSGYALAEALACGVVPIVTDIPSFRMMTDEGRLGVLWVVGDSDSLCRAAASLLKEPLASQSAAARRFFEERLSFPSIGRQATEIYRSLLSEKRSRP